MDLPTIASTGGSRHRRDFIALFVCALSVAACGNEPTAPEESILDRVDLDALFAPPTDLEIAAVSAEWATRDTGAREVDTEFEGAVTIGTAQMTVRIVSHTVSGVRHYGAVLSDEDLVSPAPVIVYAHGGDQGTSVEELLLQFSFVGQDATRFVWAIPSFRSEEIRFGGATWTSGGDPSPWDRDVDDALAFLDATFAVEPAADPDRVGILGFSRGAGVALLMGIRDDRIDRIVEFFGPTDFFDPWARGLVTDALLGRLEDLPSIDWLDRTWLQPWALGSVSDGRLRLELARRSPVLFADRLPAVQLHHGTADASVDVGQAEALAAVMAALGRTAPEFEANIYPGGDHNPLTLPGSVLAAAEYLLELLESD